VNLAGVSFNLTPETIATTTGIPNVGEQWRQVDEDFEEKERER